MENDYISDDESTPADYGYGGFESWEDFDTECDAMEESCRAFD